VVDVWIAFGALMFTVVSTGVGAAWKLSGQMTQNRELYLARMEGLKDSQQAKLDIQGRDLRKEITDLQRHLEDEIDSLSKLASEPIHALRAKVGEVEIFVRDKFLQKEDYIRDQDRLLLAFRESQDATARRLDAFESKIEKIVVKLAATKGVLDAQ
jgi:ElaB/YqjD/DUF883 family membrane-anchored ribosome-binding protein